MSRLSVRALAAPLGALLWCAILCACAYQLVRHGGVNWTRVDQIEEGIQRTRQLDFTAPVPIVVDTEAQAQRDLLDQLHRDFSDEQILIDGRAGELIGLYPPGLDLKAATLDLLKQQVAGFYDPERKTMMLVEGSADAGFWSSTTQFLMQKDVVGEMLLAHEFCHALQDQHFALAQALDRVKHDDDRALALKSVAEGDATLAGFAYVLGRMDAGVASTVVSTLKDLPRTFSADNSSVPEGVSAPLLFQYSDGVKFVAEAWRRGGWAAVNALYRDPPLSSQQIRNPAAYFDTRIQPVTVALGGYDRLLPGWTQVDADTMGELTLRIIVKRGVNDAAATLADSWRGDSLVVLRRDPSLTVLWCVVLADAHSAQQFAATYSGVLDRLLERRTAHRLEDRDNKVLVVIGEGARNFPQLAPAIWSGTAFGGGASPASSAPGAPSRSARAPSQT